MTWIFHFKLLIEELFKFMYYFVVTAYDDHVTNTEEAQSLVKNENVNSSES